MGRRVEAAHSHTGIGKRPQQHESPRHTDPAAASPVSAKCLSKPRRALVCFGLRNSGSRNVVLLARLHMVQNIGETSHFTAPERGYCRAQPRPEEWSTQQRLAEEPGVTFVISTTGTNLSSGSCTAATLETEALDNVQIHPCLASTVKAEHLLQ